MSKNCKVNINRKGATVKVEIRDETYRKEYSGTFSLYDPNSVRKLLMILEKYGYGRFTIADLIRRDWF